MDGSLIDVTDVTDRVAAALPLTGTEDGTEPTAVPEFLTPELLATELLADLERADLVISDGYVGPDRRTPGALSRLRRATFRQRRWLLSLEAAVALASVVLVAAFVLSSDGPASAAAHGDRAFTGSPGTAPEVVTHQLSVAATDPARATVPTTPTAAAPTAAAPTPTPAAAVPTTAPPSSPVLDAQQLGAQALTLVHYPWQQIPGYSIQFLPIADAPSPGFYGNTTFTWGHTGGTSTLYVYPGETVERLAGITAFEIGHEVDAAAVEPDGGEAQIEDVLGIHPASWAPDCDCAEQGYLSGWYAAAFSDQWSPGVGQWSTLAPEPTGAVLAAVEPWLNPAIP